MVKEVVQSIKNKYPKKLIILGGGNAKAQMKFFFDAGADLICLSEAEETIIDIAKVLEKGETCAPIHKLYEITNSLSVENITININETQRMKIKTLSLT